MINQSVFEEFLNEINEISDLDVFLKPSERKKFSRDFFDYSPILKEELSHCCADVVVRPISIKAVILVASKCNKYEIPLTLRGSGTGNYGQCVPLQGGVVMHMSSLNEIRRFDPYSGEVTVESGCFMGTINSFLLAKGRQLRLLPSTWRTASIGGFIAGGSGGIGSVRWGFLRDPGHLVGLEVVTVEERSKAIQLNARSSEALNHAYGTNGIITALTLNTCPAVDWQEVVIDFVDFSKALEFFDSCTRAALDLFLCSFLEKRIIECLPDWSGKANGKNRLLLLVAPSGISTLERMVEDAGGAFMHLGSENINIGNGLRELSWNHTTLHMRSLDSNWTYLQMLLPQPEIKAINLINQKWGENILWHLEAVRQQGAQRIAALPLVKWQGEQLLKELMSDCREAGAILFNPHVITVEDGGLGVIDADQVAAKRKYDPKGIMNPRKLKGWK